MPVIPSSKASSARKNMLRWGGPLLDVGPAYLENGKRSAWGGNAGVPHWAPGRFSDVTSGAN
eukprot:13865418-Alexandrium_andersonii.AAC.1